MAGDTWNGALLQTAGEALALGASEIAIKFDRMVFERYADMRIMAGIFSSPSHRDPQFVRTYLDRMRDTYGNYHWLGVADRSGRIVAASPPTMQGTDVSRATWFEEIRARAAVKPDAMFMGGVDAFVTEHGAPDTIAISAAIYDRHGTFQGAVTSRVSIPVLEAIAVETIRSLGPPFDAGRHRISSAGQHQIMRQGLRSMIEGEKDYEVVAEAVDGEMAVELAGSLPPTSCSWISTCRDSTASTPRAGSPNSGRTSRSSASRCTKIRNWNS